MNKHMAANMQMQQRHMQTANNNVAAGRSGADTMGPNGQPIVGGGSPFGGPFGGIANAMAGGALRALGMPRALEAACVGGTRSCVVCVCVVQVP